MLKETKGFAFVNASVLSLVLALAGAWYLHRSYVSGDLKTDVSAMVDDGKRLLGKEQAGTQSLAGLPSDAEKVKRAKEFLLQYVGPTQIQQVTSPLSLSDRAVDRGAYYGE